MLLARLLADYAGHKDVLVLAIPSGGFPWPRPSVRSWAVQLTCWWCGRWLKVPEHNPWELDMVLGVVAPGGVRVLDVGVLTSAKVQPQELEQVVSFEQQELDRLQRLYRGDRPFPNLRGLTVILATDAIVIGFTMQAAIEAARAKGAVRAVAAAPVGLASTCDEVQLIADEFVCPFQSPYFCSFALWYDDPRDTTDDEVRSLLAPHFQNEHAAVHLRR